MAIFRDAPIVVQVLIFLLIAAGIAVGFEYAPYSPVQDKQATLKLRKNEFDGLDREVKGLRTFEARRGELKNQIEALKKQLEISKEIVPVEKEADEFIRIIQEQASSSGVMVRRLTARPVNPREYYNEMPFEIEADGPYYSVLDFFARLGRVPRVINVTDLTLENYFTSKSGRKFPPRPGTTVSGVFTATTFYTMGAEGPVAAPAKGKQPGKPAKR